MTAGDRRGRHRSIPGRRCRPSQSVIQTSAAFQGQTDSCPPVLILGDVGRTGRLTTLCGNWPATAHFADGTRPQSPGIDVFFLGKSHDWLQHYVGDITQHLLVDIPLGSVI